MKKLKQAIVCMVCVSVLCGLTGCGAATDKKNDAANNTTLNPSPTDNAGNPMVTPNQTTGNRNTTTENATGTEAERNRTDNQTGLEQDRNLDHRNGGVINDLGNAVEDGVRDVERGVEDLTGTRQTENSRTENNTVQKENTNNR